MYNKKNEKQIQQEINDRISQSGGRYQVINEEGKNLGMNEKHPYLIIDSFEHIKGLTHHIKQNNKTLIESCRDIYDEDELVQILLDDFIERYNKAKNNAEIYKLVFTPDALHIDLKDKNNLPISRTYSVISHTYYANNQFFIIKEKRIVSSKGIESPDFAMYINSIPLIVFEVKTPKAGLDAAFKDYCLKESYSKFMLCLGTDGMEAFLTGSKVQKYKWKKYGDNKLKNIFHDIAEFIENLQTREREDNFKATIDNVFSDHEKRSVLMAISGLLGHDVSSILSGLTEIKQEHSSIRNALLIDLKSVIDLESSGLEDLIDELIDDPKNLFFYMKYCVLTDKKNGKDFLINHRVQQYYTIKKLNHKLRVISNDQEKKRKIHALLNELIVHVQRSGKSITIRSAANLIVEQYHHLFRKIYICVPDLTILDVMKKAFAHNTIKIKRIRSRFEYVKSINDQSAEATLYLYNIQKTTDDNDMGMFCENVKNKYVNSDVLFIIDEVHFSQDKQQSDIRRANFPNASFLSFTATPKIKEKTEVKVNHTALLYSNSDSEGNVHYLDELILEDAISMGIVLPVRFEKVKYHQSADIEASKEVDDKVFKYSEEYLKNSEHKYAIQARQEEAERKIREKNDSQPEDRRMTDEELSHIIKRSNEFEYKRYFDLLSSEIEKSENESLIESLRKDKIRFVTEDMTNKREKCYSHNGKPSFITKAFIVVKSQNEAQKYIKAVNELSGKDDNTYSGYRFGVDFSQQQISTSETDVLDQLNKISSEFKIIEHFESQKNDSERVDILIIVDKYLMGYDNKELVAVYCDKKISEPAKLFQLITRSATVREGKKQGFFVDLNFSEDNYNTYITKSLAYYNSGGAKIATLSEHDIQIQQEKIKSCLLNIKDILGIDAEQDLVDKIDIYKRLISKDRPGSSPYEIIKRKNDYFEEFKKINGILDILVNPKYYLRDFEEILVLSKVNLQYLNDNMPKNTERDVIFDRNEIEAIILKSIRFFDFDNTESFNSFKVAGIQVKDDVMHGKMEFGNIVDDFKCKVAISRSKLPLGFTDMITKWSDEILSSKDAKIKINEFIETIVKPFEDEQETIKKTIKEKFNGSTNFYLSYEGLKKIDAMIVETAQEKGFTKKALNDSQTLLNTTKIRQDVRERFLFAYSKAISDVIDQFLLSYNNRLAPLDVMMNGVNEMMSSMFESIINDEVNKSFGENKIEIFKNMRKDQKRMREIFMKVKDMTDLSLDENTNTNIAVYVLMFIFEDVYFNIKNTYNN